MRSRKSSPADGQAGAEPDSKSPLLNASAKEGSTAPARRSFFNRIGLGCLLLGLAGQAYAFLRSLVPNVLYEAPRRFKVGLPAQFAEGAQFLEGRKVFIFRERNTFYAVSAVCTHLGCTIKMQRLNQPKKVNVRGRQFDEQLEFLCPCHGSKYYGDGTNYAGPAPRPLSYFKLEVSPDDNQLIVDMTTTVGQDFRLTV